MAESDRKKAGEQSPASSFAPAAPLGAMFLGIGAARELEARGEGRPKAALEKAAKLHGSGVTNRDDIYRETNAGLTGTRFAGVTIGRDGKPRFEMSDRDAKLRHTAIPQGGETTLDKVLDHPSLYAAVPTAANLRIAKGNHASATVFEGKKIKLNARLFDSPANGQERLKPEAIGHILHEIQHHVQDKEGFDPGGMPKDFAHITSDPAHQFELYERMAGEDEARLTAKSSWLSGDQRRQRRPGKDMAIHPDDYIGFDYKIHDQILRKDVQGGKTPPNLVLRGKVDLASIRDAANAGLNALLNRDMADGKTMRFRRVDPKDVIADAKTFQFKSGGDQSGVTDRLKGVKTWDPAASGKTIMFERADGQLVIADGHQRLGLAKRLEAEGQRVKMDAVVLRERDGWSPRDVYAYAALKNIKESSGNALDMAKVMRERPDLVNGSVPMSDAKVREAANLSKLSKPAFDMVVGGAIKPEYAAQVGARVGETSRHADLLAEMAKANVGSAAHAGLYVDQAMAAGSITQHQNSLFGEEATTRSLVAERAAVLDKALTALKSDKRIFSLLEREAGTIEGAGNRLSHEANALRAGEAGNQAALIEALAKNRGPVSDMLESAARAMAEGKKPQVAARQFVKAVGDTLKDQGINGLTGTGEHHAWDDNARAASAAVRKSKAKGKVERAAMDKGDFKALVSKASADGEFLRNAVRAELEKASPKLVAKSDNGITNMLSKQPGGKGFRVTSFNDKMEPIGHRDYSHDETGISQAAHEFRALLKKGIERAAMDKPPRLGTGKLNPESEAKWSKILDAVPVDPKEAKLRAKLNGERLNKRGPLRMAADKPKPFGDLLGGPTTKDKIDAASRKLAAKGRTGDPADHGLFSSSRDQTDLVDMAKSATKSAKPRAVTEADIKPGAMFQHKGGKLYKVEGFGRSPTEWGEPNEYGARYGKEDRSRVRATQWQVNEKYPQGREYQSSKDLKLSDLRHVEESAPSMDTIKAQMAEVFRKGDGIKDKSGNTWKQHEGSDAWSIDKNVPKEKPSRATEMKGRRIAKKESFVDESLDRLGRETLSGKVAREAEWNAAIDAGIKKQKALAKATSGKRGTQNEANLKAIVANKKAKAKPGRFGEKAIGEFNSDNVGRKFAAQKRAAERRIPPSAIANAEQGSDFMSPNPELAAKLRAKNAEIDAQAVKPHQGAFSSDYADRERRFISRMRATNSQKTDAELKAEFKDKLASQGGTTVADRMKAKMTAAEKPAKAPLPEVQGPPNQYSQWEVRRRHGIQQPEALVTRKQMPKRIPEPRGKGGKAVGLLAPIAIGAAMFLAAKQAKAEGRSTGEQIKEAGKEGAKGVGVMAGFATVQGGATALAIKAGVTAAKAVPGVNIAMMAGNAVYEAAKAPAGHKLEAAAKGAWDMSLPGMVANTGIALKEVADTFRAPAPAHAPPAMSGFEAANRAYTQSRVAGSISANPASQVQVRKGWANPVVQAAAQAAKNRSFTGFKRGDLQ